MNEETRKQNQRIAEKELTVNGVTKTYREWALSLGIASATLYRRIHSEGMAPEDAVKTKRISASQSGRRGRKKAEKGGNFNTTYKN